MNICQSHFVLVVAIFVNFMVEGWQMKSLYHNKREREVMNRLLSRLNNLKSKNFDNDDDIRKMSELYNLLVRNLSGEERVKTTPRLVEYFLLDFYTRY